MAFGERETGAGGVQATAVGVVSLVDNSVSFSEMESSDEELEELEEDDSEEDDEIPVESSPEVVSGEASGASSSPLAGLANLILGESSGVSSSPLAGFAWSKGLMKAVLSSAFFAMVSDTVVDAEDESLEDDEEALFEEEEHPSEDDEAVDSSSFSPVVSTFFIEESVFVCLFAFMASGMKEGAIFSG